MLFPGRRHGDSRRGTALCPVSYTHLVADDLLLQGRADFAMEADYSAGRELEQAVPELIHRIRATHDLSLRHARQVRRAYERRGESAPLDIAMRGGLEEEDGAEA